MTYLFPEAYHPLPIEQIKISTLQSSPRTDRNLFFLCTLTWRLQPSPKQAVQDAVERNLRQAQILTYKHGLYVLPAWTYLAIEGEEIVF